jgi:hypothetical protein
MVDWDGTTFTGGSYSGSTEDDRDSDDSGGGSSDGGSSDGSDDNGSDSTAGGGTSSNPAPGLSGGGGVSDTSPDDGGSDDSGSDDSSGSSDNPFGGDYDDPTPDIRPDNDNPFDDGGSSDGSDDNGSDSTAGSGSSDNPAPGLGGGGGVSDTTPEPETGQGIGPSGVSGSEAATPDAETDASNQDSTEGIEATKTGELEDTAQSEIVQEQAQGLESDVAGTKITDAVSGLKTTGAEFRKEDLQVTREGDELRVELSPVGRERVGNIAERQQQENVERRLEQELNRSFTGDDVSVDSDGNVEVSQNVRSTAREQQRRAQTFKGTPNRTSRQRTDTAPTRASTDTTSDEITRNPDGTVTENLGYGGVGVDVTYGQYAQGLVGLNDPNQEIQDSLTQGEQAGIASDREERRIQEDIEQRQEFFGFGDEVGGFFGEQTGSETAAAVGRGLGDLPGTLAAAPADLTLLLDTGAEGVQNAAGTVGEFGAVDTGGAVANTVTSTTRDQVEAFKDRPVYTGTQLVGGALVGAGASRAAGRAGLGRTRTVERGDTGGSSDIRDNVRTRQRRPEDPGLTTQPQQTTSSRIQQFLGDEEASLFPDDGGQTITRSEAETRSRTGVDEPPEAQVPPRSAFSSDEAYARELNRARAKDELPPREEYPSQEQYARELEQKANELSARTDTDTRTQQDVDTQTQADVDTRFARPGQRQQATTAAATGAFATAESQTGFTVPASEAEAEATATPEATATEDLFNPAITTTDTRAEFDTPTVTTTIPDTRTRTETDTRLDTSTELRTETETETRTETETETELRLGTETRSKRPDLDLFGSNDDEQAQTPGFTGASEEVVTEFLNPLTGEQFNSNEE